MVYYSLTHSFTYSLYIKRLAVPLEMRTNLPDDIQKSQQTTSTIISNENKQNQLESPNLVNINKAMNNN